MKKNFRVKKKLKGIMECIGIVVALVIFVSPAVWFITSGFKSRADILAIPPSWIFKPTLQNFKYLIFTKGMLSYFLNSLLVASISTIVALTVGSLAGYSLARFRIGDPHLSFFMISTRMLPSIAVIIPIFLIMRTLGLLDTIVALIFAYSSFCVPYAVWLMRGFFLEVPEEIEEAAIIDGCSRLKTFLYISLPLVTPGLVAVAVINFIFSWNEYFFALILTGRNAATLPVLCAQTVGQRIIKWEQVGAAGSFTLIPVLVLAFAIRKYLMKGLTFGFTK